MALKLALIVSHPIQYYVPLYQRLARRQDVVIKVFFTCHAGDSPVQDRGFNLAVVWDIPLTDNYDFEVVPNTSPDPGTHHFFGLRNPSLVRRVNNWGPDVVHITGYAWCSHVLAMHAFYKMGLPVLFRGDSHLLNAVRTGPRWWCKRRVLKRVFSWPTGFLVVGTANRNYYETFGVEPSRHFACTHSIDVGRFAEPAERYEQEALQWRRDLAIADETCVVLFSGKFENIKRPMELMQAFQALSNRQSILVLVGDGELGTEIKAVASNDPKRFRILPFQNQSRMPIVYRLGDLFVLPSASETWGIAVNEALACGRPILISDKVGCAADVVDASCGRVFQWEQPSSLIAALNDLTTDRRKLAEMGRSAKERAWLFDVSRTEAALIKSLHRICIRKIDDDRTSQG
jgi:glycosyltransferase involved in cell wall biosynthesis